METLVSFQSFMESLLRTLVLAHENGSIERLHQIGRNQNCLQASEDEHLDQLDRKDTCSHEKQAQIGMSLLVKLKIGKVVLLFCSQTYRWTCNNRMRTKHSIWSHCKQHTLGMGRPTSRALASNRVECESTRPVQAQCWEYFRTVLFSIIALASVSKPIYLFLLLFFCCYLFVSESSNVGLAIVNIRLPGLWLDSTILDHGDRMEAVLLSDIAIISILPAVSIQVNFESAPKFVLELPLLLNIANDPTPPPPPPRPSRMQDANGDNNHNQSNTDASDQVNVPPSIELDNHHPVGSKQNSDPLENDTKEIQINNHHSSDHRPGPVGMQNGFASADSASLTSQFVLSSEIGCGRMVFSRSGGAHHRPMWVFFASIFVCVAHLFYFIDKCCKIDHLSTDPVGREQDAKRCMSTQVTWSVNAQPWASSGPFSTVSKQRRIYPFRYSTGSESTGWPIWIQTFGPSNKQPNNQMWMLTQP